MKNWMVMSVALGASLLEGCQSSAPPVEEAEGPAFETTEIADGVYRFRFERHNTMFVETDEGVVAFDPISAEAAAHYADEIKRVVDDAELAAIVYSHRHADHATGAGVLREAFGVEAPIYGHANSVEPLREGADADLPPPNITVDDHMTIGEGDDAIELHYLGKSHGDDMLVAYLPEPRVAFAVDFVTNDGLGYQDLGSLHFPEMFSAMEGLQEIPYERIVFGHGEPGDRATVDRQIQYYRDLEAAVRSALDEGLTEDETAERVLLDEYSDWTRYEEFRELNVRGMYGKLAGSAGGS